MQYCSLLQARYNLIIVAFCNKGNDMNLLVLLFETLMHIPRDALNNGRMGDACTKSAIAG